VRLSIHSLATHHKYLEPSIAPFIGRRRPCAFIERDFSRKGVMAALSKIRHSTAVAGKTENTARKTRTERSNEMVYELQSNTCLRGGLQEKMTGETPSDWRPRMR
jgi:hypothetical protein